MKFAVLLLAAFSATSSQGINERIPDTLFFDAFDLSLPSLEPVAEAVRAEDYPLARARMADHFRNRKGQYWWFDPHEIDQVESADPQDTTIAQRAIERKGAFDESRWLESGELDWVKNAGHANWGRMYFFQSMGLEYWNTREEHPYATVWVDLMRSWIKQVPPEVDAGYWATMTVGIRMRTGWPHAFNHFLLSPSFTDEDMVIFLKSTLEQTRYLRENHSETSNWLTFEMAGLYSSGVLYPEFREAADWRSHAVETAVADMDRGYLPDGSSIELSPGYHQFFSNYLLMYDLAKAAGREEKDGIGGLRAKTEAPYTYYVKLMAPNRFMPAYNDNRPLQVTKYLDKARELFPQREDFAWVATDGAKGTPPPYTSIYLPYAGSGAMRSGWERDANHLGFDFGPLGYRHAHQDKLNVVLWAYGREILFDPGKFEYADTPLLRYCSDTFSHNTVIVDDRPQRRAWYTNPTPTAMPYRPCDDVRWKTSDAYDFAAGVYDGHYGKPGPSDAYPYKKGGDFREGWSQPARHHRRIFFLKPDLFLIADTLVGTDGSGHEYDLRWHLDSTEVVNDGLRVRTADAKRPNLELIPVYTEGLTVKVTSAQEKPELLGWKVGATPEPATTAQHLKTGDSTVQFLTVLAPLKSGEEQRVVSASLEGQHVTVKLSDGRKASVTVPTDPARDLDGGWVR